MSTSHRHGRDGERLAAVYLEVCGYEILARRWRRPGGELDIVAARDGGVVFVEVKTRGEGASLEERIWIAPRQRSLLRRVARRWLAERTGSPPRWCRFDLIAVAWRGEGRGCSIRHLPDAF